jgi:hypothetical protein
VVAIVRENSVTGPIVYLADLGKDGAKTLRKCVDTFSRNRQTVGKNSLRIWNNTKIRYGRCKHQAVSEGAIGT